MDKMGIPDIPVNLSTKVMWILIVFYLDPGGFLYANLPSLGITFVHVVFLLLGTVLFVYNLQRVRYNVFKLKYLQSYLVIILIWNFYYFTIFYGTNNNEEYPGVIIAFLRNMTPIINSLIVIPIVYLSFYSLSYFMKVLVISTLFIGLGFILTVQLGIPLVPTWVGTRSQLENSFRTFMYGYGIMNFVVPIFIAVLYTKLRFDRRILIAVLIIVLMMLITVFRRDIVGVVEHALIIALLVSLVERRELFNSVTKFLNLKSITIGLTIFITLTVFAPNYLSTAGELFTNSLAELGVVEARNSSLRTDVRMSLTAKIGIVRAIRDNFYFGTGFDENWFFGDGGVNEWEGADYVFLGAFGMYGLIGLLLFLPFYILAVMVIIRFVKMCRAHFTTIKDSSKLLMPFVIGIAATSEIIKNILEYPNWYYPVGAIQDRGKYFIFFGLLLGCYYNLKFNLKSNKYPVHETRN